MWASLTMSVSASVRAVTVDRFAWYPVEKVRAASLPVQAARASSSSPCSVSVPVTRREAPAPAPQNRAAAAADVTRGLRLSPR